MPRRRKILLALLIPTLLVAGWQWLAPTAPYDETADPEAAASLRYVRLKRDHSFHWMHIRLETEAKESTELLQGLALILSDGSELTPAGLELEGHGKGAATEQGPHLDQIEGLTVQFWLEAKHFQGPMQLRIGDDLLRIRQGSTSPQLPPDGEVVHKNSDW